MIFGKPRSANFTLPECEGDRGDPWDEATLHWLEKSDRMDFEITWLHERVSRGEGWIVAFDSSLTEAEAVGHLSGAPQHVRVEVKFAGRQTSFGDGVLTWSADEHYRGARVNVPVLTIYLKDEDGAILAGLREALKTAIVSGDTSVHCRIFEKFAAGWSDRTSTEYLLSFEVTDMMVWSTLKAPGVDGWAGPTENGFWDLSSFIDARRLRATPVKGR